MTSGATSAIAAVLDRVDFLANRGALIMRAAAVFTWAGAAAATIAAFSALGTAGWVIGIAALVPGWLLWRYGAKLAGALDAEQVRSQIGDAAGLARSRLGEVVDGVRATRRQPIRGGFRVLRAARGLRSDLAGFGVDVAGLAEISNPGSVVVAVASLVAGIGLWLIALAGAIIRIVL